ncbi:MAG: hypothetical protein AAGG75_03075 [Bacteroidota bacterium]
MLFNYRLSYLLLMLLFALSCANNEADQLTWVKENYKGKQYRKLAVVCVNESKKVRKKFRKRIVRALKAKGVQAASGKDLFPDGLTEEDKDPEHFIGRLNSQDVDGVLVAFIVREKTMPEKRAKVKGEGVYWVGSFVYRRLTIDYQDDQDGEEEEEEEEIQESFIIETVLHDVSKDLAKKKETLVWRNFSDIVKDTTTKVTAQQFADSLAVQLLEKDQVVKLCCPDN